MPTKKVTISLPQADYDRVQAVAESRAETFSETIRRLALAQLDQEQTEQRQRSYQALDQLSQLADQG